jgi:HIRAN domain
MKTLYLAWRQPNQRWWPIGRLSYDGSEYAFTYTKGARSAAGAGFHALPSFPDLDETYYSKELFPLFANRLPRPTRSDYGDFVEWLDLGSSEWDPMGMLARSGGQRETDMFEVFPAPERDSRNLYNSAFFVHGLRHRGPEAEDAAGRLAPGDPLVLQPDPQNPHDPKALRVLTTLKGVHLGFVPRYLCDDVHALQAASGPHSVAVRVRRINAPPAPSQFRVLCEMSAPWPSGFQALAHPDFEPIPALMPAARP